MNNLMNAYSSAVELAAALRREIDRMEQQALDRAGLEYDMQIIHAGRRFRARYVEVPMFAAPDDWFTHVHDEQDRFLFKLLGVAGESRIRDAAAGFVGAAPLPETMRY